ncbi:MAG: hypothetical protein KKH08_05135 [Candidatus Omnitrophica bacterium]|nr:hypothetical protein [Candidatus Omnitrophota bacterium]
MTDLDIERAESLREKVKKWLYFENYDVIDIVMAVCIINRKPIDPVWLFLVDPPSSGKTEILRAFFNSPKYILSLSSLTPKSLISGKVTAESHNTPKDPSLFARINNKIFIVKDFTTVLSLHPRDQAEIFSLMRDSYDGYVEKKFGQTVNVYRYKTHYGFLGGVTLAIDQAYTLNQIMGERFLKYRLETNRKKAQDRANQNRNHVEQMRTELNAIADSFLSSFETLPEITWSEEQERIIDETANLVTLVRTPVARNWQKFEIIEVSPAPEMPMRFASSLKNLADGLAIVRGKKSVTDQELKTVIKVAFDSLPVKLFNIIQAMWPLKDYCLHKEIAEIVKLNTATVTRVLDDFFAIGVTEMDRSGGTAGYKSILKEKIRLQLKELLSYRFRSDIH